MLANRYSARSRNTNTEHFCDKLTDGYMRGRYGDLNGKRCDLLYMEPGRIIGNKRHRFAGFDNRLHFDRREWLVYEQLNRDADG